MSSITPKKIAHYYAWPSGVNGSAGVVATAAAVYADYDVVVFGAGIDDPSHGDNANTTAIIADPQMANTEVYGYIDATAKLVDNMVHIDNWKAMGVDGIFCDKFGYDWNVSRDQQNELYWCIHTSGLKAYVNAWNPDDVFSSAVDATHNPNGVAPWIAAGDSYLLESHVIENGTYQTNSTWQNRGNTVAAYKAGAFSGVDMMALTTYADGMAFDQNKLDYAFSISSAQGLQGFGFGEFSFSSSGSSADSLPYRTRPTFLGTRYTGPIAYPQASILQRPQNVGLQIDITNHTVSNLLDEF